MRSAAAISTSVGMITDQILGHIEAIMAVMLTIAAAIVLFTQIDTDLVA